MRLLIAGSVCSSKQPAVIGGLERWRRRLDGYRAQVVLELADCKNPDDAKKERLVATVADVDSLKAYALPVLEELERLPREANGVSGLTA